jgi:sporulation protein YlmC with PRC-barrel domain
MSYTDRDKYGIYQPRTGASSSVGPGPSIMGADTLIGDNVVNGAEESLGDIKEIMLDMHTGQVAYAVLSFGGFLGIGEKLFAVPWSALHLDTVNERFMLNVDKARLKNAPGFDPGAWPDMSDVNWARQIHTFYGTDAQQPGAPTMGPTTMGGMVGGGMGSRSGASAGNLQSGAGTGSGTGSGTGGDMGNMSGGTGNVQSGAGTGSGTGGDMGNMSGGMGSQSGSPMPGTRGKKDMGGSDS